MKSFKKIPLVILISFLAVNFIIAQGQTRNLGQFDGVNLGLAAELVITQGSPSSVAIEAPDDVLNRIKTEVRGGVLQIKQDNDDWKFWKGWSGSKVRIYVTNPVFSHVAVSGSGNIKGKNQLESKDMYVAVSGSGKMDLEIKAVDLESKISGSGNVRLKGSARNTHMAVSGSGNINAEDLASENCEVRISGSGNCRVQVDSSLDSRVSGSGNVYYRGNPQKLSNKSSGSGSIKKI